MRIEIPDKTAAEIEAMLARQGASCDLETHVRRTLARQLVQASVGELRSCVRDIVPSDLEATIDEAIRETRRVKRESSPGADRS